MAQDKYIERGLKRMSSLQNAIHWLNRHSSHAFESLTGETLAAQPLLASPTPEDAAPSSSRYTPSLNSTTPASRHTTFVRVNTPLPRLDVHISTSPIDWLAPVHPRPEPAPQTAGGFDPPLPLTLCDLAGITRPTEEELARAALRQQARLNINRRAAAAAASVSATPTPLAASAPLAAFAPIAAASGPACTTDSARPNVPRRHAPWGSVPGLASATPAARGSVGACTTADAATDKREAPLPRSRR